MSIGQNRGVSQNESLALLFCGGHDWMQGSISRQQSPKNSKAWASMTNIMDQL